MEPVGEVISDIEEPLDMPLTGQTGMIRIYPQFMEALDKIEDNSHLWILSWFHKGDRTILKVGPKRVNEDLPERGVFGLRTFGRPNPIGLSLTKLIKVDNDILHLSGLDAIEGTPVLDIKPYFEQDIVFSPMTPYIRPAKPEVRQKMFLEEAYAHHQEDCSWLEIGVRLAMIIDEELGQLQSPDLKIKVTGHPCLADVIQGLTHARFASPQRFEFEPDNSLAEVIWTTSHRRITTRVKAFSIIDNLMEFTDDELFEIS